MESKNGTDKVVSHYLFYFLILGFLAHFLFICRSSSATPILFFSDLVSGPKTGWENSSTRGAAVSVWGLNLGSKREGSFITASGAELKTDSDYAEWGITGTENGVPRGLDRITFWLNNNCHNGEGEITVTVNGIRSNSLPFRIRTGRIYFVDPKGNDSNNGRRTSAAWRHLQKFSSLSPGDILYARGGEYTSQNFGGSNAHIILYNLKGNLGNEIALVGYPGETPWIAANRAGGGLLVRQSDWSGTTSGYLVFSKFKAINGGPVMFLVVGDYIRIIGNWAQDLTAYAGAGIFNTDNSRYVYMYGNYIKHCGSDNWAHAVYGKTKSAIPGIDTSYQYFAYNEIDGYIDSSGPHGCGGGMLDYSRESDAGAKTTHHIYIHSNLFKNSGGGVFFTEGGSSYPVHHIYIYNNLIINGTTCNTVPDGQFYFDGAAADVYVFNNTIYKGGNQTFGAVVSRYLFGQINVQYKNNIYVTKNNNQPYFYLDRGSSGNVYSDHDAYYNTPVPSGSRYSITNALVPGTGIGFVNESGSDFRLGARSPCIDAGTSEVSDIVRFDYLGTPRPQGSKYDIGAFEYYR